MPSPAPMSPAPAPMKLWGGRFTGGPVARARGAERVDPVRLGAGAVRHRRLPGARQGAAPGRIAHRRRAGRDALRARPARRGCGVRRVPPAPRRRGRAHRAGARPAGPGRLRDRREAARRAVPQRPGRHPVPAVPARPRPHRGRDGDGPAGGAARPGRRASRGGDARPDALPARAAGAAGPPPGRARAGAGPRRRPDPGLGPARGDLPVRVGRARRVVAGPRPGIGGGGTRDVRRGGQFHRRHRLPRFRRRARLRVRDAGGRPVPVGRGGRHLHHRRVRLRPAARCVRDRVVDHAAEEEPGHRGAGARQGRPADRQPDRPAGHAEGPPAGLQPRSAGGQGAADRLGRPSWRSCCRRSPG